MDAVRNGRLFQSLSEVYCIERAESYCIGWWLINRAISMCEVDCSEHIRNLKESDIISYLVDPTTTLNNGDHPVAIVRDAEDRVLYESPGYRMGRAQSEQSI